MTHTCNASLQDDEDRKHKTNLGQLGKKKSGGVI